VSLPRLRAPVAHGAVLAVPPLAELPGLLSRNRSAVTRTDVRLDGTPLADLRRTAAAEIAAAASSYLRDCGEPAPDVCGDSLFLAGHQPDLFHPGVWLKNFALNALAGRHGSVPLNLVVDNDTAKSTSVRVPVLGPSHNPSAVRLATVPYDHFAGEIAYEERAVVDENQFAEFPRQVAELAAGWGFTPILPDYWEDVLRQRDRTPLLGERFAAARRAWERRWGCHNLELPISRLCGTEAFARFAADLLDRLPAFHMAYNESVRDYRRRHGIRSPNHPVPDLARDGDWLEAPFWAWRAGSKRRGRLFVRPDADGWQLRAGAERWPDLTRQCAVEIWRRLGTDGFKVRTRALTTTLFARLFLADLFIHGIGGGKYDELTDALLARHYGLEPPGFLVLTGTLYLPLPNYAATTTDLHALRRRVRDLYWNPQRHLPADIAARPQVRAVLAERAALESERPDALPERRERYQKLRSVSDRLRPLLDGAIDQAARDATRAAAEVAANAVLRRRDYAYCLYPGDALRPFLTQFDNRAGK
jgi:hypothetical protein